MRGSDSNRPNWLVCSLLALVTLALYWPVRHYDFVDLDDPGYVFENQVVSNGVSASGLIWSLVDAHEANWHPLTWFSHMLDCQCFGLQPGAHHLVNVLFHCANAVALFLVLRAMTGAFWRCAFVAAAFAWHPLRVESVAWISERKDVLSGLFFMLTLWAYVRYVRGVSSPWLVVSSSKSGAPAPARSSINPSMHQSINPFYLLALLFFALGLMSKPMLVTTPFVLLLLDFWPLRRVSRQQPGQNPKEARNPKSESSTPAGTDQKLRTTDYGPRTLFLEKLPFFALSGVVSIIAFFAQRSGGALVSLKSAGFGERVTRTLLGSLGYLEKFFWPQRLAILYLPGRHPAGLDLVVAFAVLVLISGVALATARRRPYLAVGWFWFLGMLVPVCGFVQVGPQYMADRYTYLPGIGLLLLLAWSAKDLLDKIGSLAVRKNLGAVVTASVLIACLLLSRHQLGYWQNTRCLMERALQVDPNNYIAHNVLGAYFTRIGRPEAAAIQHRQAQELWPP